MRRSGVVEFAMSDPAIYPLDMGTNTGLAEFVCVVDKKHSEIDNNHNNFKGLTVTRGL